MARYGRIISNMIVSDKTRLSPKRKSHFRFFMFIQKYVFLPYFDLPFPV